MKKICSFIPILLLLLFVTQLSGQSAPDSEFAWIETKDCTTGEVCKEIFVKVEKDPVITQYSKNQFEQFVRQTITALKLGKEQSGTLKLKLLFPLTGNLCLSKIGSKELILNEEQEALLGSKFNSINQFQQGTQRSKIVNCQSILYIDIIEGKLVGFKNVNFVFGQFEILNAEPSRRK